MNASRQSVYGSKGRGLPPARLLPDPRRLRGTSRAGVRVGRVRPLQLPLLVRRLLWRPLAPVAVPPVPAVPLPVVAPVVPLALVTRLPLRLLL